MGYRFILCCIRHFYFLFLNLKSHFVNIIFFAHPTFLGHQSLPRFTRMLSEGMKERGHAIEVWSPKPVMYRLSDAIGIGKWLGYIDQYILFPASVRLRLKKYPKETLFVLTDQALGPWLPMIKNRLHVVHCHDFLALHSALGAIPENKTRWSGRKYQAYIRKGFSQSLNFISVSQKTKNDLGQLLKTPPLRSKVVYNGLNQFFGPCDPEESRVVIGRKTGLNLSNGYMLHIGGNQWYKNRRGVIEIYDTWREQSPLDLPLLMIGEEPSRALVEQKNNARFCNDIHFLNGVEDDFIGYAYGGSAVFIFPSLAEGFGWPIAEAMACGSVVVTTDEAPMTEVAGKAAFYIPRRPFDESKVKKWAQEAAKVVAGIIALSPDEKEKWIIAGIKNAERFKTDKALDAIERIYEEILLDRQIQF